MKQALDTRTKLLTKSPWPLMIELSIPAVLGMVVVGLYNMMDSIFVGQMVGDVQMGAISVSYPLTLINAGSAAMLGVGSASVLSRAIGKKDENTIKKIMGNLVAMVLLLSVIYTVVGMVFTRQLLSLTGASDNILNYAEKYLRIIFAGSLFVNFFQSANMVIRGEGQLKKAMTIIASGAILNIILDPIFISILNPYGMGIEAAAYATIFSQFVQAAITLWYFKKKSPHVKIGRIRIDGELLPQVLSVGVSALLMQILTLVQQTVIYRVASNYGGETSQLLLGAALRFWNFSFVPLWGISQGFQPAAGTNYGAKDYDRVKTLTRVFITAATLLSLVFYIPADFIHVPDNAGYRGIGCNQLPYHVQHLCPARQLYDCRNPVPVFGQGEKGNLAGAVPPDHSVYSSLRGSSDDRRHGYSWRMAGDCSDRCNSGGYYRFYDAL